MPRPLASYQVNVSLYAEPDDQPEQLVETQLVQLPEVKPPTIQELTAIFTEALAAHGYRAGFSVQRTDR